MKQVAEQNKAVVRRFNKEFIEEGNLDSFKELVADDVCNHSAPAGASKGPDGMIYFISDILRKGFPDISVEILDQVAEEDKVTSRKILHATHLGEFMGIPPTHKKVAIHVIDIIRLRNGKYVEHWGSSNLAEVMAELLKN
jgi:predicted ester cyclase